MTQVSAPGLLDELRRTAADLAHHPGDKATLTDWYVAINDEPTGPITHEMIRGYVTTGKVNGDNLVWREGFDDWHPLREIRELGVLLEASRPFHSVTAPPARRTSRPAPKPYDPLVHQGAGTPQWQAPIPGPAPAHLPPPAPSQSANLRGQNVGKLGAPPQPNGLIPIPESSPAPLMGRGQGPGPLPPQPAGSLKNVPTPQSLGLNAPGTGASPLPSPPPPPSLGSVSLAALAAPVPTPPPPPNAAFDNENEPWALTLRDSSPQPIVESASSPATDSIQPLDSVDLEPMTLRESSPPGALVGVASPEHPTEPAPPAEAIVSLEPQGEDETAGPTLAPTPSFIPQIQRVKGNRNLIYGLAGVGAIVVGIFGTIMMINLNNGAASPDAENSASNTSSASGVRLGNINLELPMGNNVQPQKTPTKSTPKQTKTVGETTNVTAENTGRTQRVKQTTKEKNLTEAEQRALAQASSFTDSTAPVKRNGKNSSNTKNSASSSGRPLGSDQIRSTISKNQSSIQRCYEREMRGSGGSGDMRAVLRITVQPSGVVSTAKVRTARIRGTGLGNCMEAAARRWRFPRATALSTFDAPFLLTPGRR